MAQPVRVLVAVIWQIKDKAFSPDLTRSGMLAQEKTMAPVEGDDKVAESAFDSHSSEGTSNDEVKDEPGEEQESHQKTDTPHRPSEPYTKPSTYLLRQRNEVGPVYLF